MQNTVKLYGVVEGYEKISFVLDKFKCVFFNADPIPRSSVILVFMNYLLLKFHSQLIFKYYCTECKTCAETYKTDLVASFYPSGTDCLINSDRNRSA